MGKEGSVGDDDCISKEEIEELRRELSLDNKQYDFYAKPKGPGNDKKLHSKRLQNLRFIKRKRNGFDIDPTLTMKDWDGKNQRTNPIELIRKKNPLDYTKWKVKLAVVHHHSSGLKIGVLRPGKEAHVNYSTTDYHKKRVKRNQFDTLPVILDGKKVVARNLKFQETKVALKKLKREQLRQLILDSVGNIGTEMLRKLKNNNRRELTKAVMIGYLLKKGYEVLEPKVNNFTPWTLEHLAEGLEKIKLEKCGKIAVEIIGTLLVRMAYMLDHDDTPNSRKLIRLKLPPAAIDILSRILPDGIQITEGNEFVPIESVMYLFDLLGLNEEVKVDWKGIKNLEEKGSPSPKGRVNTLLTYATFMANAINSDNIQSTTIFQYQRSQNDPRPLEFYKRSFRFLKRN